MDKKYPRLVLKKVSCHCGSPNCKKADGLPWQVHHHQFANQANPVKQFEAQLFQDAIDFVKGKLNPKAATGKQYTIVAGVVEVN